MAGDERGGRTAATRAEARPGRRNDSQSPEVLEVSDLTELERQVVSAAETGKLVDLSTGDPEADSPERGGQWSAERTIRAGVLAELLMGTGQLASARVRAVRIQGARVSGQLDLEGASLRCSLALRECYFEKPILLAEASGPAIRLKGSRVPGISAPQLMTQHNLELAGCTVASAQIDLSGAHVGGDLDCSGAKLRNPEGRAISAEGLQVDQNLYLGEGFEADGEVRLLGAHVGLQLDCSGAKLRNPSGFALLAADLQVDLDLFLGEGFEAEGEVSLLGAHLGGQLSCTGGKLRNPEGRALSADLLQVDRGLFLNEGFEAEGEVRFLGAHLGGLLSCNRGKLRNPGGLALDLESAKVDGELYLHPAAFEGGLHLTQLRLVRITMPPLHTRRRSFSIASPTGRSLRMSQSSSGWSG